MLLKFTFSNFKSFRDENTVSMEPVVKQKDLTCSILRQETAKGECQGLCSSVFYGPNASGKSSIVCALHVLKMIVLRGNIRNKTDVPDSDIASQRLELIPSRSSNGPKPIGFSIVFCHQGHLYSYSLSFSIGTFMDMNAKRSVTEEELSVDGNVAFRRKQGSPLEIPFSGNGKLSDKDRMVLRSASTSNLDGQELFLTGGFKSSYAAGQVAAIQDWFENQLLVFYHSNTLYSGPVFDAGSPDKVRVASLKGPVLTTFGITGNSLGYFTPQGETKAMLCSIIPSLQDPSKSFVIPAETFESLGTTRFMSLFPILKDAIGKGKTLVIDGFDASLDPSVVMSVIKVFHNNGINRHGAQLLFSTQNPLYLRGELFRRDEIKFVDRDGETQASTLYSLSDFPTTGGNAVRKGEDYMGNYLSGKYGAVRQTDLSPLFGEDKDEAAP